MFDSLKEMAQEKAMEMFLAKMNVKPEQFQQLLKMNFQFITGLETRLAGIEHLSKVVYEQQIVIAKAISALQQRMEDERTSNERELDNVRGTEAHCGSRGTARQLQNDPWSPIRGSDSGTGTGDDTSSNDGRNLSGAAFDQETVD